MGAEIGRILAFRRRVLGSIASRRINSRNAAFLALGLVILLLSVLSPGFLSSRNLLMVLRQISPLAILSMAQLVVVLGGGINLSVGEASDLSALVAMLLIGANVSWVLAMLAGLTAGALVGVVNGLAVAVLGIDPFLATLATMFVGISIQLIVTRGGLPIYLAELPGPFWALGNARLLGVPVQIIMAAATAGLLWVIIERTGAGRYIVAVGESRRAAFLSGVRVGRYVFLSYVLSGLLSAVAGLVLASHLHSAQPQASHALLLSTIGAVFMGTLLHPQRLPTVSGVLFGVLLLGLIENGLVLRNVVFYWQAAAQGLILLVVMAAASFTGRET